MGASFALSGYFLKCCHWLGIILKFSLQPVSARGHTPLRALPTPTPWLNLTAGPHPPVFHSSNCRSSMACSRSSDPTTTGGHTWPIYGISLEHPAPVARQDCTSETHKTSSKICYFSRLGETEDLQKAQRTYKLMKTFSTSFVIREM